MTTKVTVDAHAGWPVRVTSIMAGGQTVREVVANTVEDFFVHSGCDFRIHEIQPDEQPTFGQKAVGASFNPSALPQVDRIKALYAEVIDVCNTERAAATSPDAKRHWSIAITDAEAAQMRAVKAATWKD